MAISVLNTNPKKKFCNKTLATSRSVDSLFTWSIFYIYQLWRLFKLKSWTKTLINRLKKNWLPKKIKIHFVIYTSGPTFPRKWSSIIFAARFINSSEWAMSSKQRNISFSSFSQRNLMLVLSILLLINKKFR